MYTGATWGVQIHINLSVPGVWKQYTELQKKTCFMHEHMGHASLLTNTCTTVLGHRRVYMAYIYINSLFNMFFFKIQHLLKLSEKYSV